MATFEVIFRRCDNLYDVGGFGDRKIDPFVKCIPSWLEKDKKTNWQSTNYVDDGGTNIVFDEIKHSAKLKFPLPDKLSKPATLLVEVYDYDQIGSSDFIGSCEYDIYKLVTGKSKETPTEVTVNLKRKKRKKEIPAGTVFAKMVCLPVPAHKTAAAKAAKAAKAAPTKKKKKKKGQKVLAAPELTPRTAQAGTRQALQVLRDSLSEMDMSIKQAFDQADDDTGDETYDNAATHEEFESMIDSMVNDDEEDDSAKILSKAQIQLIIHYIDSDNNGTIDLEEFTNAMSRKIGPGTSLDLVLAQMAAIWGKEEQLDDTFELFDGDESGSMSYEEFETTVVQLFSALDLTPANISALQRHFDLNLDGTIHSVEFRTAIQSKLVSTTTTITTINEDTGESEEQEIDTEAMEEQPTSAAKVRAQRTMPGLDMSLKKGTLHVRIKRGDLSHDTSGMMDKKMDPYVRQDFCCSRSKLPEIFLCLRPAIGLYR